MAKEINVSALEYSKRREHIGKHYLKEGQGMMVFGSSDVLRNGLDNVYPHRQESNFYYLTGIKEADAILIIFKDHQGRYREVAFVQDKDPFKEKWTGYRLGTEEASVISGVDNIMPLSQYETRASFIINGLDLLYMNYNYTHEIGGSPYGEDSRQGTVVKSFPHLAVRNALDILKMMRIKKSPTEIKFIKEAIKITKAGLYKAWKRMKPGMKEYELRAILEYEFKRHGGDIAFNSIVASGENGVVLHYVSCDRELQDGDMVLFDVGAEYGLYSADITRTVPVNGRFTEKQRQFYNLVLKANKETIKSAKAGRDMAYLNNEVTMKVLAEGLMDMGMIEKAHEVGKYYYHGVSHYLGLDTHDLGERGPKGMPVNSVITVEPGLYVKEENLGIRIEDDILIKRDGNINLSKAIAKEVDDIERIMR